MARRRNFKEQEMDITREEELKILEEFIEKNGVKVLPPDERGPETVISPWKRNKKKKTS